MGSNKGVQLLGCIGKHGSYAFFKSIKIVGRTYTIASHFPVRIWPDSTILSLAEVQLLWTDRAESFCSLKLYFLPENTPDGRHQRHGEDEVIALQDKVIIRASDLISWLVDDSDWDWGYTTPSTATSGPPNTTLTKAFHSEKFLKNAKEKELMDFAEQGSSKVVVLNYERYIRLRTVLKRLEGSPELSNWLSHPLVLALGGLTVGPNCRLLFAKEVFDYPELEDHELLCNHLAPKLKGKPKRRRRRRNPSLGSESNESETSSTGSCGSDKVKKLVNGLVNPVKVERGEELFNAKQAIEDSIADGARFTGDLEEVLKNESSSIKRIANKLISEVHRTMANGKIRNDNSTSRINNSNHHFPGDSSSATSHSGLPLMFPHSLASKSLKGEPENGMDVELLGPALSELAQKLEKSNALQILPIRPSVIQKPDTIPDEENHQGQGKKRLKTDSSASSSNTNTETNSNFRVPPPDMDFFTRNWNGHSGRLMQSIYGPPPPRQSSASKPMSKNGHSSKAELQPPPVASIIKVNHMPKVERPVLSITPVDMDGKKINNLTPSMRMSSPSPFVPTGKIYGDPGVGSKQQAPPTTHRVLDPVARACNSGSILDFSVKRRRLDAEPHRVSLKNQGNPSDSELLDLSTKSQLSCHGQNNSKKIFHSLADIPPPNAMNQLGLRLTSEVTLFPSNPSPAGSSSGHKSSKEVSVSKSHHNHIHSQRQSSSSSGSKSSASKWEGKQPSAPSGMYRSSSRSASSSSNSSSVGKVHGASEVNSHHHHAQESHPSSAFGLLKHQLPSGIPTNSHRSSKSHKSEHQQFTLPPSVKERERLPLPGHSRGTAAKPVATMSLDREREGREAREKTREREHDNSTHYNRNNHLGHGVMHPPYYRKMDPAYLQLFAPPMFMPPTGVSLPGMLGMAGMQPGAMEQIQLYQEFLQKGLGPQFAHNFLSHESAKERGQK